MNYRLYTISRKAWDAMLSSIREARRSIYLEMYIFSPDTSQSHDFISQLEKKAQSGVRVVVVADAFGSLYLANSHVKRLRAAGAEVFFFSHWLRRVHRKILIVDEKTAFVGGVNIGKEYRNWNDLELKLSGRVVAKMLQSFSYTYLMAGGKDPHILIQEKKKLAAKFRFWLIDHWPAQNIYTLKNHYVEKITRAKKTIQIVTPYFMPPRWLISLLDDALRRGLRVEIIIPKKVDYDFVSRINFRFIRALDRLGAKFYLTDRMNHAKLLLIDDEEGLLGSQNFDWLSFHLNAETGVFFKEKKLIQKLDKTIAVWKHHAQKFNPGQFKMRPTDYLVGVLVKIFRPIL